MFKVMKKCINFILQYGFYFATDIQIVFNELWLKVEANEVYTELYTLINSTPSSLTFLSHQNNQFCIYYE